MYLLNSRRWSNNARHMHTLWSLNIHFWLIIVPKFNTYQSSWGIWYDSLFKLFNKFMVLLCTKITIIYISKRLHVGSNNRRKFCFCFYFMISVGNIHWLQAKTSVVKFPADGVNFELIREQRMITYLGISFLFCKITIQSTLSIKNFSSAATPLTFNSLFINKNGIYYIVTCSDIRNLQNKGTCDSSRWNKFPIPTKR